MNRTRPLVVVTPVFEDRQVAQRLFSEIRDACGNQALIVAVDDGSICAPLEVDDISAAGLNGIVLKLARNAGHQRAIAVGLHYVASHIQADRIVVMDSDGEDLPSTIPVLLDELNDPLVDVVVAHRKSRVESLRFKSFYTIYKLIFWLLTGRRISFGNYMALKPNAAKRLAAMGELGTHVAGTVLISRLRWKKCPLDRGPRYAGQSKMNFVGLVLHGFKGLMVFAEDVLVRVGAVCGLVATASLFGMVLAVILKSIGYATPGWFSVALGVLLLMFLQTGAITLMTLLLTGVARNGILLPIDYDRLIADVIPTSATLMAPQDIRTHTGT